MATFFSGMFAQVFLFTVLTGKGNVSVNLSSGCLLLRVKETQSKKKKKKKKGPALIH